MLISKNISIRPRGLFCLISKMVAKPNKNQRVIKTKTKAKKLFLILSPRVFVPNKAPKNPTKLTMTPRHQLARESRQLLG